MPSAVLSGAPLERLSIRAALAIGIAVTLGLWLVTGYTFARRIDDVERQASVVAARYMRAQELLGTVRTQVLLSSVRVRDALLNPDPSSVDGYRDQIQVIQQVIVKALDDYEPVLGSAVEQEQIVTMRWEVDEFHQTSLAVLADARGQSAAAVRDVLNHYIVPRREAAVKISEDIQTLNRLAFIRQQTDIGAIHRAADRQSWRRLGLALAISLGVLILAGTYSARLEGRLRRQLDRDARLTQELHGATVKLLGAQEEERRTIARELHDEVGQVLTAIKVELGIAQRHIEAAGLSAEPLTEAQAIADGGLCTVRDITQLLHPAALDDLGLAAAIDASLRGLARRHDIKVELSQVDMGQRLAPVTEVAAYRVVQEALTNVARHSRAAHCWVKLIRLSSKLVVEVQDDGAGFDPVAVRNAGGFGLIGIRERTGHLGGTLRIDSAPGCGTRLSVELPVEA
ncbi:MAG: sensor histidine kinase [Acidobacteriota bacterium]|nr:sensor histidine kinase [Acidobacteriota bacterium]